MLLFSHTGGTPFPKKKGTGQAPLSASLLPVHSLREPEAVVRVRVAVVHIEDERPDVRAVVEAAGIKRCPEESWLAPRVEFQKSAENLPALIDAPYPGDPLMLRDIAATVRCADERPQVIKLDVDLL